MYTAAYIHVYISTTAYMHVYIHTYTALIYMYTYTTTYTPINSCQHTYRQSGERRPHHVAHSMVRENQSKTIFQHVLSGRGSKTV